MKLEQEQRWARDGINTLEKHLHKCVFLCLCLMLLFREPV